MKALQRGSMLEGKEKMVPCQGSLSREELHRSEPLFSESAFPLPQDRVPKAIQSKKDGPNRIHGSHFQR